jgi:hypothetical protein
MSRRARRDGDGAETPPVARDGSATGTEPRESRVRAGLWQSQLCLLVTVLVVGLGLVAALALGWRSPTPHRAPDWSTADLVWRGYGAGSATITNEGYRIRLLGPDQRAWAVANQPVSDFELELDVHSLGTSEDVDFGLLYRYQDLSNTYLFAIGGDGYYTIAIVRQGQQFPLRAWQQWPHVRRGAATNRLRIRCRQTLCRFYVNGEFTAEISDDAFLTGSVGFWAQSFSDAGVDVVFEELRLWSLD